MFKHFNEIYSFLTGDPFRLICDLFSFFFKSYLLYSLIKYSKNANINKKLYFILITLFISSIFYTDICNIITNIHMLYNHLFDRRLISFVNRLGWLFSIIQAQSIYLLLQNLANPKFRISRFNFGIILGMILGFLELYFLIFEFNNPRLTGLRFELEGILTKAECLYMFFMVIPTSIIILKKNKTDQLPHILIHQLHVFIYYLIIPYIFLELFTMKSALFPLLTYFFPINRNLLQGSSAFLISYIFYYCSKKIIGLRFLNLKDHVQSKDSFNFANDFNGVLEQLSSVTTLNELANVAQVFFHHAFNIPKNKTKLYLDLKHQNTNDEKNQFIINNVPNKIENHLANQNNAINSHLNQSKILIKDEIEFTNFYNESENRIEVINFLKEICADIFLPIYEGKSLISCIIVEQDARRNKLYTDTERDEMLIFSSYLNNVINILKKGDFEAKLKKEKDLQDELYKKHQEINQYKESLKLLLKNSEEKSIGIIFYKNQKLNCANHFAHELIPLDFKKDLTHPIKKELIELANQALKYKTAHKIINNQQEKISLYAIVGTEPHTVIILAQKLVISEMIKSYFDLLKNPSLWDYLIYLETTESGRLINKLIPGSSQNLLDLKVELLSIALSKQATLIEYPEEDIIDIVDILHNISLRQKLQIINLANEEKHNEFAIKLFGINSILGQNGQQESILENLDKTGTLFIQNIELLSIETQNLLAEFISYGYFKKIKSLSKIFSDVRIICSSKKNLQKLTSESLFSPTLFDQLKKSKLYLPSLHLLSEVDLFSLIEQHAANTAQEESSLLKLESKDMMKILADKPTSLNKLKEKINSILSSKITKQSSEKLSLMEDISDPHLMEAINAGKKALKNKQMLQILWDKYKNQSKIASLLNVHRSSVNRRCEEYGIN